MNRVTLTRYGTGESFGEFLVEQISAHSHAAVATLLFSLSGRLWKRAQEPPLTLVALGGELLCRVGGRELLLGRLFEHQGPIFIQPRDEPSVEYQLALAAGLGQEVLHRIEDLRGTGGIVFVFSLSGLAAVPWRAHAATGAPYEQPAPEGPSLSSVVPLTGRGDREVAASTWTDLLEQLGFGAYRLVSVGARARPPRADLKEALARASQAERRLLAAATEDDYAKAVGDCRFALDQIAKAYSHADASTAAFDAILKDVGDPTLRDALRGAMQATKKITNLGHHDAPEETPTPPRRFTRAQAEYVLHLTLALIGLAAKS